MQTQIISYQHSNNFEDRLGVDSNSNSNNNNKEVSEIMEEGGGVGVEDVINNSRNSFVIKNVVEERMEEIKIEEGKDNDIQFVNKKKKKERNKGSNWLQWLKELDKDIDSEDEFEENELTYNKSKLVVGKEWNEMSLFEKALTYGEKIGGSIAYWLGLLESKYEYEKLEYNQMKSFEEDQV
ncbi:hypothetical protein ABK040_011583 [Willaertia magna]